MLRPWFILFILFCFAATTSAKPKPANYFRNNIEEYIEKVVEVPVGQLTPLNIFDSNYFMYYADTLNSKKRIDGTILVLIPKRCPGRIVNKSTYKYMVDSFLQLYPFSEISVAMHNSKMNPVTLKGKLIQYNSTIAILVDNIATIQELKPTEPLEDSKSLL